LFCICQNTKKIDWEKDGLKGKIKQLKQNYYDASLEHNKIVQNKRNNGYNMNYFKQYNNKGNCIELSYHNANDSLITKTLFDYNDKGCPIEERLYVPKGHLSSKSSFMFDDKGNLIGKNNYNTSRNLSKNTWQYDDKGNIIEEKYYKENDVLDCIYKYKYDDKGNQIEKNVSCADTKKLFKVVVIK